MNETINNEIEMDNIETAVELDLNDLDTSDFATLVEESDEAQGFDVAALLGIAAAVAAAIGGGIAIAKKKKNNGEKKEGFVKKMAINYLTKKGYKVEQVETTEDDQNDVGDCDDVIFGKK